METTKRLFLQATETSLSDAEVSSVGVSRMFHEASCRPGVSRHNSECGERGRFIGATQSVNREESIGCRGIRAGIRAHGKGGNSAV